MVSAKNIGRLAAQRRGVPAARMGSNMIRLLGLLARRNLNATSIPAHQHDWSYEKYSDNHRRGKNSIKHVAFTSEYESEHH